MFSSMSGNPEQSHLSYESKEEREDGQLPQQTSDWNYESQVPVKTLGAHTDGVTAARFCLEDGHFVSCSSDCTAMLWEVGSGRPVRVFRGGHDRAINECALMPETHRLITISLDKMLCWDLETGHILWKTRLPGTFTSCCSSPDGGLLVCASLSQCSLHIIDAASGQSVHRVNAHHEAAITCCRFDPQSERVATVSSDRTIKLWDLRSQKTTLAFKSNHSNTVSACCFTSNGHSLCSASWDRTLKLWDLHGGGCRGRDGTSLLTGHEGCVSSCTFSQDDAFLVSGSYDKRVCIWDTTSLCQSVVLKGHSDWVTDVSISANNKMVLSASKDQTIRLWDIENIDEIPAVMELKKTHGIGVHILKCEECGKPFPVSRLQSSELLTKCTFCRLKSPSRYRPQPPPLMPI